jgi:hypothetical protein
MTMRIAWKADTELVTDIRKLMGGGDTQTHRKTESKVVAQACFYFSGIRKVG